MAFQASNIGDLITTSLPHLGKFKFTDLSSDYYNTIALKRILKKKKMKFDSGPTIRFNVMFDTNGSARFVPLGYTVNVNVPNVMTYGEMPWRHATFNWAIEAREEVMNSGESKIVDIMQTRRMAAFGDWIKLIETQLWAVPDASDELSFQSIPYWIVKSNTAATKANNDGFNGGAPSGFTTVANLSPTTYRRWRNYATQYTSVSKDDLIRKMRRAAVYTKFMPLVDDMPVYDLGEDFAWYTNYSVLGTMEEILESQNESLGSDIASMDGKVVFRRAGVVSVQELDNDTTNPVYGIYWGELFAMRLRDWWMKEGYIGQNPNQPTVAMTNVESSLNTLCRNRRRQSVIATDTTMAY
jgi:hypothetical protein